MQDSNILEKDYVFLHYEVNRCHNLKEGIRRKIKTRVSHFLKKMIEKIKMNEKIHIMQ